MLDIFWGICTPPPHQKSNGPPLTDPRAFNVSIFQTLTLFGIFRRKLETTPIMRMRNLKLKIVTRIETFVLRGSMYNSLEKRIKRLYFM